MAGDPRAELPEAWKLATMYGTAAETAEQAARALIEIQAAIAALDLADTYCPDCGHPRTCDVCSCTGPGTCGGGTDDIS